MGDCPGDVRGKSLPYWTAVKARHFSDPDGGVCGIKTGVADGTAPTLTLPKKGGGERLAPKGTAGCSDRETWPSKFTVSMIFSAAARVAAMWARGLGRG